MKYLHAALLFTLLTLMTGPARAAGTGKSSVALRGTLVAISIAPAPLTRVRVNLDNKKTGEHREVEWDPARSSPLTQIIRLKSDTAPANPTAKRTDGSETDEQYAERVKREKHLADLGGWAATMWAEPMTLTAGNNAYFLQVKFDRTPADKTDRILLAGDLSSCSFTGTMVDGLHKPPAAEAKAPVGGAEHADEAGKPKPAGTAGTQETKPPANLNHTVKISFEVLDSTAAAAHSRESSMAAPFTSSGRAAGTAPDAVVELLQIFAEIAVDKAKSRAFEFVANDIKKAVCEQLTWSDETRRALHLSATATPDDGTPLLPRTCASIQHLRLADLASSARAISVELVGDLADLGIRELEPALEQALLTVLRPEIHKYVVKLDDHGPLPQVLRPKMKALRAALDHETMPAVLKALEGLLYVAVDGPFVIQELTNLQAALTKSAGDAPTGARAATMWPALGTLLLHVLQSSDLFPGVDRPTVLVLATTLRKKNVTSAEVGAALAAALDASPAKKELPAGVLKQLEALKKSLAGVKNAPDLDTALLTLVEQAIKSLTPKLLCLGDVNPALECLGGVDLKLEATLEALAREVISQKGLKLASLHIPTSGAVDPRHSKVDWKQLSKLLPPDLANQLTRAGTELSFLEPVVRRLVTTLIDTAAGKLPPERAGQLVFAQLSSVRWVDHLCEENSAPACPWACGMEAGFALLGSCMARAEGCTSTELGAMISNATKHIEGTVQCKAVVDDLATSWPGLGSTVLHGLEILRPSAGATPRSIALGATDLVFDLLEQRYCAGTAGTVCLDLKDFRAMVKGILEERIPSVLVATSSLLERALERGIATESLKTNRDALIKVTRVAGALTAYASTYALDPKGDPEQAKAAHEARRKAVEGLIDASTDRTNRKGAWVLSLGVNPGFSVSGYQHVSGTTRLATSPDSQNPGYASPNGYTPPQLQLPMGLALQKLPDPGKEGDIGCGRHFQLSIVDLGQFVALDENTTVSKPRWDSFVLVGVQAGVIIGTPSNPFVLGVDARWAPTLFTQETTTSEKVGGAFRAGIFASYYVPFFDFN